MRAAPGHTHPHAHCRARRLGRAPISYAAHIDPALRANLTVAQVQDVLVAIAPIVGTARVMTASGNIATALGIAIAVADAEIESETKGKG